jgi:TM2 domain-containing membrane protein YozV
MDCVNHSGANAAAYCQNCGKALCQACVRRAPGGQVFCEPCMTAWQSAQRPYVPPPTGAPNPVLAAILGVIPGVGAMYNGQFLKGLVHVLIFAVLVSACHVFGLFGLLVAGWVFYQVFEAYHTARARRDGEPLPDPLGLNDVGSWLGINRSQGWTPPGATAGTTQPDATQAPFQGTPQPDAQQQGQWQTPYQGQAGIGSAPVAGFTSGSASGGPMPPVPPAPPAPPTYWRRPEPIGAVFLIALGIIFLLDKFDFLSGRVFEFTWPVALIGLGVWMILRNVGHTPGGQK